MSMSDAKKAWAEEAAYAVARYVQLQLIRNAITTEDVNKAFDEMKEAFRKLA